MTRDESPLVEARSPASPRAFGITMAVVASVIALFPLLSGHAPRWWAGVLAIALLVASGLRPILLAPANRLWLGFSRQLHKVTSLIVLGAMFFLVLTPLALVLRALGSDRLRLKRTPAAQSYWVARDPDARRPDFERPF